MNSRMTRRRTLNGTAHERQTAMIEFNWIEALGTFAGIQTTVAFLPQVLKVWRSKSAQDISLATFSIFTSGVIFWLIYGLLVDSFSITAANIVTLFLAASIVVMKLRYDKKAATSESVK